jgi:DNA-binding beta-propeller fold protein YncE
MLRTAPATVLLLLSPAGVAAVIPACPSHAAAPAHIFRDPIGVAVDAGGNVYVTDQGTAQVIELSPAGRVLARWGRQGKGPGRLNIPEGIAVGRSGRVYVADTWNSRIQVFSPRGRSLARWGATRDRFFFRPQGLAVDRVGNVYVADDQDDWIYRLSPAGKPLARLGRFGNPTQGEFRGPTDVAADAAGRLYVPSYNWIYKLSRAGKTLAVWGTLHPSTKPGRFTLPDALAVDGLGNVYVADTGNARIQKLSPSGAVLAVFGTRGPGPGQFRDPTGIAVDAQGNIYIVDGANRQVTKLSPSGAILATWR